MREIKFRGKVYYPADDKGETFEWVYGGYDQTSRKMFYRKEDGRQESPYVKCVGQYTGLTDKNGKEIYEGDIVKIRGAFGVCEDAITVVKYHETHCQFVLHCTGKRYDFMFADNMGIGKFTNGIEVIGNIYDGPYKTKDITIGDTIRALYISAVETGKKDVIDRVVKMAKEHGVYIPELLEDK